MSRGRTVPRRTHPHLKKRVGTIRHGVVANAAAYGADVHREVSAVVGEPCDSKHRLLGTSEAFSGANNSLMSMGRWGSSRTD